MRLKLDDQEEGLHLGVCEAAILQDLEHHVKDIWVGLLNLIKEHHCVRPPPDSLCQLPALIVAHIACTRACAASSMHPGDDGGAGRAYSHPLEGLQVTGLAPHNRQVRHC